MKSEKRDEVLFQYYIEVLQKHGKYARFIPKNELYDEVGRPFFIGRRRVYDIIKKCIKNGRLNSIDDDNKEVLVLIKKLHDEG